MIFLEPKRLYWSQGRRSTCRPAAAPFGRAVVRRAGPRRHADRLRAVGARRAGGRRGRRARRAGTLEVVDLRTLVPFDDETVVRLGAPDRPRAWSSHEAARLRRVGAEIAARVTERCFHSLARAGPARHRASTSPTRRRSWSTHHLPGVDRILDAVDRLQWDDRTCAVEGDDVTARAPTFLLPDLGEGLTEAEIVRWLVAVGDEVAVDQIVVEVETAKAVVEVPCPYAGRGHRAARRAGPALAVGSPLMSVATAGRRRRVGPRRELPDRAATSRPRSRSTARRSRPGPATC